MEGAAMNDSAVVTPADDAWPRQRWAALAILLAGGFMDLLDTTIVNVAIPSIRQDLHTDYAVIQWLIAGYLLAVAVVLITGGRLGDLLGRKRMFLVGVVAFGATSLLSGLAPSPNVLVAARVLQGLSAAIMIPQILSVIQVNFPRKEQSRALSLYSSIAGIAVMSGPLMAGLLLTVLHLSWRSMIIPESRAKETRRLDLGGVVLISTALFALVFSIIQGRELGWPAWIFVLMAASVPLFLVFALYESGLERRGGSPLVSMTLFGERAFSGGLVVVVVFFSGLVGFFLAFTVFLQLGLNYSPLDSALTTFPSSVGLAVASLLSPRLIARLGRQALAIGALVMALAQAGLILTVRAQGASLTPWNVRPIIFVFGLGMGLILPSLADVIIARVKERNAGAASGILNTGLQVGNAIGVAVTGVILFTVVGSHAATSAASVTPRLTSELSSIQLPQSVTDGLVQGFQTCFNDRAHQEDPSVVPDSCDTQGLAALPATVQQRITATLSSAGTTAREDDFVAAIQWALLWEVAVFLVTIGLLFLVPRMGRVTETAPETETAAATT
ncbi:MAG: MFS transporter [Chloroflexi bacterium]|nr:MAG: MFS transporter [Chloroflexota bacterium]